MVDRQSLVLMWVTTNRYFLFQSVLWLCPPPHGFPASHSRLLLPKALCPGGSWDNLMLSQTSPQTSQHLAFFGGGLTVNVHKELSLATPHPSFVPSYLHILVPTCISNYKREADGHRSPGKFTIAETEWGSRNRISNDSSEAGRIAGNWTDTMAQRKPGPHGHPEDRRGLLGTFRSQGL